MVEDNGHPNCKHLVMVHTSLADHECLAAAGSWVGNYSPWYLSPVDSLQPHASVHYYGAWSSHPGGNDEEEVSAMGCQQSPLNHGSVWSALSGGPLHMVHVGGWPSLLGTTSLSHWVLVPSWFNPVWEARGTNLIFLGPWTETFAPNLFILRIILAKCNFQALVGKLGRTGSCFTTRHANMRSCTLAGTGTCSPIKDLVAMSISLDYNMKGDESARILLTVLYKCRSSY
jgi:hypothetical protein